MVCIHGTQCRTYCSKLIFMSKMSCWIEIAPYLWLRKWLWLISRTLAVTVAHTSCGSNGHHRRCLQELSYSDLFTFLPLTFQAQLFPSLCCWTNFSSALVSPLFLSLFSSSPHLSLLLFFSPTEIRVTAFHTAKPLEANNKNSSSCPHRSRNRLVMAVTDAKWQNKKHAVYLAEHLYYSFTYK